MPRAEVSVENFDLVSDLRNYYLNCVVTHEGAPAHVSDIFRNGPGGVIRANIQKLPSNGTWGRDQHVDWDTLDLNVPRLGFVRINDAWHYLARSPQRRMRKGYNSELVRAVCPGGFPSGIDVMNREVVRQIWYGNGDRIGHDVVVFDNAVYYEQDAVATIDAEGNLILVTGKEKLGEFVCKLLANNWETLTSRTSIRRLPS